MPGPAGVPRADIIPLLREGLSDRAIGRALHTNPKRVGRIRRELGLPEAARTTTLTRDQAWATHTRPAGPDGEHLVWTGYHRGGTYPVLTHLGIHWSARRIAFELEHGRPPVGRVLPSCNVPRCIRPACTTDEPMRNADALYEQIFGAAA